MRSLVHRTAMGEARPAPVTRWRSTAAPGTVGPEPRVLRGRRGGEGRRIGIFWSYLCGGGVETVNRDIADSLPRDEYIADAFVWQAEPTFLGLADSFDELVVLDQPFEPVGDERVGPFTPVERCASFQRFLMERRYDLFIMSCCWAPMWVVHMHGIPIIEYWHGFGLWNGWDMPSQAVVAVSETTLGQIEAIRPHHAPATVIRNAVDADRYAHVRERRAEARARLGLRAEAPVVLYCGRFSGEKRPEDAMRAFVRAREEKPDLQLLMVGTIMCGWEEYWLDLGRQIGLNWGVDAVRTVLSHDDIGLALAAADVMLHPSEWEGLGMVLLEGLAAGLPIVSTCAGGCGEVLDGVAVKVGVGDTEAMAREVNRLLGDAEACERMRQDGQRRVREEFTLEEQGRKLEGVIEAVVGG